MSGPRKRESWRSKLLEPLPKDSPHKLRPNVANAVTVLTHDERWSGVLAYDEFAEGIITVACPPWRERDAPREVHMGDWTDEDTTRTQCWLSDAYGLDLSEGAVLSAVRLASRLRVIHPVRDWLTSLRWDAKMRLPTWLVDVMGCEDSPYVRAIGTAWAVSAVARAFEPGCKVDTVLVLEGKPGTFKSSVLRAIAGDAWFLEMAISDVSNKDAMQILRRKWIAEFPEIDGLSRVEQSHVKAYFSRQVDTYRASYGKGSRDYPRQTVFAATTNKSDYLTDETGGSGRRMWPVKCARGDVALARTIRDQFWAEAVARYQSKEDWYLRDPELRDAEVAEQDARYRPDPWEHPVATWLAKPGDIGVSKASYGVSTADILTALGLDLPKRDHGHAIRVGNVMRRLGWVPGPRETRDGIRLRLYRPADGAHPNGHALVPIEPTASGVYDRPEPDEASEDLFPPQAQ